MTKLAASGIATAFALVMLGGSALSNMQPQPAPQAREVASVVHVDNTRIGQCRIEYDANANMRIG
jgi:hypothetical protein